MEPKWSQMINKRYIGHFGPFLTLLDQFATLANLQCLIKIGQFLLATLSQITVTNLLNFSSPFNIPKYCGGAQKLIDIRYGGHSRFS